MTFYSTTIRTLQTWRDFRGISSRKEFWWFQLFLILANVSIFIAGLFSSVALQDDWFTVTAVALLALWGLTLVPATALAVRRLRDGGFSWKLLFLLLLPFGGLAVFVLYLFPSKQSAAGVDTPDSAAEGAPGKRVTTNQPVTAPSQLARLAALHASGKINDQQFTLAKEKLTGQQS